MVNTNLVLLPLTKSKINTFVYENYVQVLKRLFENAMRNMLIWVREYSKGPGVEHIEFHKRKRIIQSSGLLLLYCQIHKGGINKMQCLDVLLL